MLIVTKRKQGGKIKNFTSMKFYTNIFLLLMIQIINNTSAVFMKCPLYELNFQKIVGYRPPSKFLTESNLIYSNQILNNNNNNNSSISMPLSILCWEICAKDPECISFVLLIDINECYGFSLFQKSVKYNYIPSNIDLAADFNAIYFEKTCLKVPDHCRNKLWVITKIPGNTLVFQGKKTLPTLVTRRECAERCIFEQEFLCLSASFIPSYKNNVIRLGENYKSEEILGRCILSNKDKTIQPDVFRAASKDEEYIENQCYNRPIGKLQCSFELYSKTAFIYAETFYDNLSQRECQNKCLNEKRFYCQGVTFIGNLNSSKCYLHSEDLISLGPRSLKLESQSLYMRRVRCLNISVVCNHNEMTIKYSPNDWFRGKLYTNSHSEECSVQGNGTLPTILRLPIGNEVKENRCGILRAYEVKGSIQRVFISTLIVVQYNLNVQAQGDRLIKVGCILNNIAKGDNNEIPDDISLESTLAFTQTEFPNEGSIQINDKTKELPHVYMKVIDVDHSYETNDVHIGQNLELQIIVDPPDTIYDIQAKSLIAHTDESGSITLIDNQGCPTDITIFPALKKINEKNKKMLKGNFHAFKFAGTSTLTFDVKIHFCLYNCPEPNCNQTILNESDNAINDSKRAKRSNGKEENIITLNNDTNTKVRTNVDVKIPPKIIYFTGPPNYIANQENLTLNSNLTRRIQSSLSSKELEIPLKLKLHVRGPYYGETDTLICGENSKILVAGFDFRNPEEWCINHSLLIAIIIFWIILQIIFIAFCCYFIKRYKRMINSDDDRSTLHRSDMYSDYIDGRKVHWADQGTMSEFSASQIQQ